jgi:hypothetical protein
MGSITTPFSSQIFNFRNIDKVFEFIFNNFLDIILPGCTVTTEAETLDQETIQENLIVKTWNMDFDEIKDCFKRILDSNGYRGRYTVSEDIESDVSETQWISRFIIDQRFTIEIYQPYITYVQQGLSKHYGIIKTPFKHSFFDHTNIEEIFNDVVMRL